MSHHVEQQAGEHIVANDGISMRNTPRNESPTSPLDVGQLLGKNQAINGLLSGAGENGFDKVLASQVKRDPVPSQPTATRKDTVANDNSSRSGGNSSPHSNSPTKNASDNRKADRGNDKPDPDVRRAGDARKTPEKASSASNRGDSVAPEKKRSSKGDSAEITEKSEALEKTDGIKKEEDAIPTAVDGYVANTPAPVETSPSVETAEVTVAEFAIAGEASATIAAVAPPLATDTSVAAPLVTVTPAVTLGGEMGITAEKTSVAAGLVPELKNQGIDPALIAGKDLGMLQRAISAANAVSVAPDMTTNVAAGSEDVVSDALPDPALKDLITAMIKSQQNAGMSADKPASEAEPLVAQAMSANKPISSADQTMAALTRELQAPDAQLAKGPVDLNPTVDLRGIVDPKSTVDQKGTVDQIGAMQKGQTPIDVIVTSELTPVTDEFEPLATTSVEGATLEENKALVVETDAHTEAEAGALSLDVEGGGEPFSQSITLNKPAASTERPATAAIVDPLTSTSSENESAEALDSWSILDAATEIMPEDATVGGEVKLQSQVQTEQQMALVRNELRNLERFVDGGLQAAVRGTRDVRKEDKPNEIKPAALSRAIENLGAGVKTAELRASTQVANAPVAFGRQGFAEQMAEKIMLMTTQKVQVADIRLDPKEMGTIEVKIRVHQDQTSVVFSSANPQVRDALESSIPRLREMFADAGVGLGSVNVNDRGTSAGGNNEQSQGRGDAGGFGTDAETVDERKPVQPRQSNGLVDYYA